MKKRIDDSMDDEKWEQTRRVIASTSTLAEVSEFLEEDTAMIHRRHRRDSDNRRRRREKPGAEDHSENPGEG